MSDERRDQDAEDEGEGEDPGAGLESHEEKGLGLTEEFRRLESEIEGETGRRDVRFEEADSTEFVAPAHPDTAGERGGETDEWTAEEAFAADDAAAGEPDPGPPSEPSDPSDDEAQTTPAPDSEEGVHGGVPDAPAEPPVGAEPPATSTPPDAPPAAEEPAEPTFSAIPPAAEQSATEHTVIQPGGPAPIPIPAGAYGGYFDPIAEEDIEDRTPALWWRFLTGSVMIVAATATAVALSSLLALNGIAKDLQTIPGLRGQIAQINPGDPETILIVGSDKRSNTPGDPGRSDTTMLLRVDAQNKVLSLFSLPRDLKVDIAGKKFGTAKLNEAFTDGGVKKTLATVQDLTGLEINHVVNVDFQGFADAVDAIGCVYVDADRHYFNDNSLAASDADTYAVINVNAGYQRLCGQKALDYVRFRHEDNDFVRAARQQDFLRNARAQVPVKEVLPIIGGDTGSKLLDIFTKYTSSDIRDPAQVISVLKAFIGVRDVPINEVHFAARDTLEGGVAYVEASKSSIRKAVKQFLGDEDTEGGPSNAPAAQKQKGKAEPKKKPDKKKKDTSSGSPDADLAPIDDSYARFGRTSARRLKKDKLPVYIPQMVAPESLYRGDSRQYEIKDTDDKKQPAYKMVIQLTSNVAAGQYYGVEGTTWKAPPILDNASETRTIDGRHYDLYYDGDRLRIVAFHAGGNSYWVSNTLLQVLDEDTMLGIAESMTESKG